MGFGCSCDLRLGDSRLQSSI